MTIARHYIKVAYIDQFSGEQTAWADYAINAVLMTEDAVIADGGRPYYSGRDWKFTLCAAYIDDSDVEFGQVLTSHAITWDVYDIDDTAIISLSVGAGIAIHATQTARSGGGNAGEFICTIADTETPDPGEYRWYLKITDTPGGGEIINEARGLITVRQAP